MGEPTTKTEMLKTVRKELMKQYIVYDGSSRMTDVYEGPNDMYHGAPCIHTQYGYDGPSTRIYKMRESYATWDSTWDL